MKSRRNRPFDDYPTPRWCVDAIFDACAEVGEHFGSLWLEPAAGAGAICEAIRRHDPAGSVHAIEVQDRHVAACWQRADLVLVGDALELPLPARHYDVVLTNPPYRHALRYFRRFRPVCDVLVMLLRVGFLESRRRRGDLVNDMPDVYVLSRRPSFRGGGTDSTAYAWFVWHERGRQLGLVRVI